MSTPISGAFRTCRTCKGSIARDSAFCPNCRTRQHPLSTRFALPEPWTVFDVFMTLLAPLGLALMIMAIPTCEREYLEMKRSSVAKIDAPISPAPPAIRPVAADSDLG